MTDQDTVMQMAVTSPKNEAHEANGNGNGNGESNGNGHHNHHSATLHRATWLPRDIPYNEAYENSIQDVIENSTTHSSRNNGIVVLSDNDDSEAALAQEEAGVTTVRARDIQLDQLPDIPFDQLPLPLDDPRRIYASAIPGIRLTHPGGYFEGGPGGAPLTAGATTAATAAADGDSDEPGNAFARDFIAEHGITNAAQLREAKARAIEKQLDVARERMRARREALQHNARIGKEIKTLTDQREMELKIETRMRDEARAKRERREKRREKKSSG